MQDQLRVERQRHNARDQRRQDQSIAQAEVA